MKAAATRAAGMKAAAIEDGGDEDAGEPGISPRRGTTTTRTDRRWRFAGLSEKETRAALRSPSSATAKSRSSRRVAGEGSRSRSSRPRRVSSSSAARWVSEGGGGDGCFGAVGSGASRPRRGDVAPRAATSSHLWRFERTRARELVVEETRAKALRGGGVVLVRLRERHVAPAVGVVPVEAGALARGRGVGTRARGGSRGDLRGACVALVEHYGRTRGIRRRGAARGGDRRQIRRARRAPLASVGFARARGGECEGAAKSEREKTTLGTSSITILSRTEGNSLYGYLPWDGKRIKPCIHCLFHQ